MHRDPAWYDMATPEEQVQARGEHGGRQQVYNTLLSWYLDEYRHPSQLDRGRAARQVGRSEALIQAAMITWGIDEAAATQRVGDDLEKRLAARAD